MNSAVIVGRVVESPELRYTQSGDAVCTIRVAVNRPFTNKDGQQDADFIPVVAWRKLAENIANYVVKGQLVSAEGRIQVRKYVDRDGGNRYATEIVANQVNFLTKPRGSESNGVPETADYGASVPMEEEIPF